MPAKKSLKLNKLIIAISVVSMLVIPLGCSKSTNTSASPTTNQSAGSPAASDSQQDKALTKALLSETIVESGQVYIVQNDAVGVIKVKKGTDDKTTKELATKYADTIKKKYKDKKVNVHANMEGIEIAHITL